MRRTIIPYNPRLKEYARYLRRNMTLAEVHLWKRLKGRQVQGYDFDRQRPIGEFIVDFYCKDLRLAIEVDGRSHDFKPEKDAERQETMEKLGVRFLRFWDQEVKTDMPSVLRAIEDWIAEHEEPTPSPSEEGNGDEEPTPSPSEEGNGDEEPTPSPSEEGNGEEEPTPNPSEEGNMDEAPLLGGVGGGSASEFGTCIDITSLSEKSDALFNLRGGKISMIFQEPMTALSPVHTVGNQICEAILLHQDVTESEARAKAIEMLGKVGIPGPEQRIDQYPFEMSGGMRQRVVIAMALVCNPEILIADEPTTALDVTIQAQIMGLIKGLQRDLGTSTLLITHDLGVVAQLADDVAVMYLGRIVERGPVRDIMKDPKHPYTQGLLKSLPSLSMEKARLPSIEGSVPSLTEIPPGCPFHPRCPSAKEGLCNTGSPPVLEDIAESRAAACVRLKDLEVANA